MSESSNAADGRPPFDKDFAHELIGKIVLVGFTYVDMRGNITSQEQFYGVVTSADARTGLTLELCGSRAGETHRLPPDTRAFFRAEPGEYRLRSSGEIVSDPDYTSTWTIERPDA